MILNEKQKLIFRFAVVIKAGEADAGGARNVAHRSRVITLGRKNAGRGAEDVLQLLIVARKV